MLRKISVLVALLALSACLTLMAASGDRPVAHFYYTDDQNALESLRRNHAQIDLLSPSWFTVDPQGRLQSSVDPDLVQLAAEKKLPLMPLVINQDFRSDIVRIIAGDAAVQKSIISQLMDSSDKYGFYGIQLDIEEVPADKRDSFTEFVRQLAAACSAHNIKLSVAVPSPLAPAPPPHSLAAPAWIDNDHAAGFDYVNLAAAADFISLMVYDEFTADPGPIAGLPWVEACIAKALTWVPAGKLHLGLPLYYRQWAGNEVTTGPYAEARLLAASQGVAIGLDSTQVEKIYHFTQHDVLHTVWFNDAETLQARLTLVRKYHLRGYSAWRLGQEDVAVWRKAFAASEHPAPNTLH